MSDHRRVQQQPGYVLHHRPFRDSSRILDVLTRDHGKVALVARGSRGKKSKLAGILRPFMPLRIGWVAKSDLGTMTGAESAGVPAGLHGDAMLSAYYVNELLLHFLHRYDPQPEVFDLYERVLNDLAGPQGLAASLRAFEIELLGLLGYALTLETVAGTHDPVDPDAYYEYRVEHGAVPVERRSGDMVFSGSQLLEIAAVSFDDDGTLRAANRLLRSVVSWHLGGKELNSRKVMMEMHRGRIAPSRGEAAKSE